MSTSSKYYLHVVLTTQLIQWTLFTAVYFLD